MTLKEIFKAREAELRKELDGLELPKDASKIETVISANLAVLFADEGEYRQNLTQAEDYILQAALSLLKAQQDITQNIVAKESAEQIVALTHVNESRQPSEPQTMKSANPLSCPSKVKSQNALIGSTGGALVGNLLFGGWGAVFGAIAGTAIVIYTASKEAEPTPSNEIVRSLSVAGPASVTRQTPIDINAFIAIIGRICESVDNLVETFRVQIRRVVDKYESQEKPTIERNFRVLLEGIQSLLGYKRGHSPEDEKYLSKLQTRVEDLAELLDNYDLEVVDYRPEHSDWFEAIESNNATQIKLVNPAIVKGDALVLKGKIFTPKA